jgi:sec-independent protein translocase protein TatB
MFDVSFSELVLILIVGLLVFGPEKLPEVVRTAGLWIGKLRRSFNNIRSEIEREVGVDELRRDLHNQSIMDSLKGVQDDLRGAQQEIERLPQEFNNSIAPQPPVAQQAPAQPATAAQSAADNALAPAANPAATQAAPQQHHSS